MLLAGMQGPPVLCSGHAVQRKKKRIAALARFSTAIALMCTDVTYKKNRFRNATVVHLHVW